MPLEPGTKLGPYEVTAPLGAGGMGEVYRARDTKLNRDVALSPDGRWLAYASLASGEIEVYVRPFPNVDSGIWQISSNGGRYPLWGPDGDELFFWTSDAGLMRVAIDASTTFQHGNPESLVERGSYFYNTRNRSFDISPDGERFLMVKQEDDQYAGLTRIIVVRNWHQELLELVPLK